MASTETSRPLLGVEPTRNAVSAQEPKQPRRSSRLTSFWKALIITSFAINLILIFIVFLLVGFVFTWRNQLISTTMGTQSFARDNVAELRNIVKGLQDAKIVYTIPLDQPLPLRGQGVVVPVNQETTVELTQPVQLTVENADIQLGAAGALRADVTLSLPAGTRLPIRLNMGIPLDDVTIPVKLNVPVEIPLKDTDLGPLFKRLGEVVDRLAGPAAPLLGLDIPEAPPAPTVPPQAP